MPSRSPASFLLQGNGLAIVRGALGRLRNIWFVREGSTYLLSLSLWARVSEHLLQCVLEVLFGLFELFEHLAI